MQLRLKILINLILPAILFSAALVFAADFTSPNFIFRDPVIDVFGGVATSSSFQQGIVGGQNALGESTSTNFVVLSGFLYFNDFTPASQNWRWYDDETNETPGVALANENAAPINIVNQNIIKLRLTIKELGGIGNKNTKFRLQFSEYSDFSRDVQDVVETSDCADNSLWCYADGAGSDNALIQNKTLSDADSCLSGIGNGCGTHNEFGSSTSTFIYIRNAASEYEFTVKHAGARANAVYFFRVFDLGNNKPVVLKPGASYPSLATEAAKLTFSISGLPSGTATEGIITDAATTPLNISFSSLNPGLETEVAQRLTVTTNGTDGYRIFIFQRQGLLGDGGSEIAPINSTNETPLNWSAACPVLDMGCYGYHSGDDTLSGNAGRFAANDTYAKLENSPKETAFSPTPVANESVDIIFKAQIGPEQPPEDYQSSVGYIIVPVF
ncbi:MAG: hypothetical protein HYY86_00485 [Candidatus Harrisonbacteria bacterium]|nr:hypothetical protein [Candidatus Harrisonbacteria bacterium]